MGISIRALVIDDSVFYRKAISNILFNIKSVCDVVTAPNAEIGLEKIPNLSPHIVFLDLHMDGINGIEALKIIKKRYPEVHVAMISSDAQTDASHVIEALKEGAIEFLQKPNSKSLEENTRILTESLTNIIRIIETGIDSTAYIKYKSKKSPETLKNKAKNPPKYILPTKHQPLDFILIGVSTGGPQALMHLIGALPNTINTPILVAQHMPPVFTQKLAEHLNAITQLTVQEAQDADVIEPNHVYIAKGGFHMNVQPTSSGNSFAIALHDAPPIMSCKPSINNLLTSMSLFSHKTYLVIILTGMGEDGAEGVAHLKKTHKSTFCIAQDEASSTVFGMPKAIIEQNLADEILSLEEIPQRIIELCNSGLPIYN